MNFSDLISGFEQAEIEECLKQKVEYVLARYSADVEAKKLEIIKLKFSTMMRKLREYFGGFGTIK
ncbi:MAG: hypothetical protein Q8R04_02205 [Nanoarchaeota archaeon]|nr:hypothetical protein [Nanoarchaeota archaeon]